MSTRLHLIHHHLMHLCYLYFMVMAVQLPIYFITQTFKSLAEQDGFILVYPQGSLLNGVTHWNVGGWTIGSTVDDVGFTEDVIDIID